MQGGGGPLQGGGGPVQGQATPGPGERTRWNEALGWLQQDLTRERREWVHGKSLYDFFNVLGHLDYLKVESVLKTHNKQIWELWAPLPWGSPRGSQPLTPAAQTELRPQDQEMRLWLRF